MTLEADEAGDVDGAHARLERRLSPDDKREMILLAAAGLFIERGFENASLGDLAERLGVTKPTIYYYYRSKDDLLLTIKRRGVEAIKGAIDSTAAVGDVRLRLRAFAGAYLEIAFSDLGRCIVSIPERALSHKSRSEVRSGKALIDHFLRTLMVEGAAAGVLRPVDPRHAAAAFFGMLNWVTTWRTEKSAPLADIAADMVDIFLVGAQTPLGPLPKDGAAETSRP